LGSNPIYLSHWLATEILQKIMVLSKTGITGNSIVTKVRSWPSTSEIRLRSYVGNEGRAGPG